MLAAFATSACSLALDWNSLTRESGPCRGDSGPAMVQIGSYCIDATEVTGADYQLFFDTNPDVRAQIAECALNTTFMPTNWPLPPEKANHPVTFVDWCDAFAYCAWAGKALCGRLEGGPVLVEDKDNPDVSQWYRACTRNGTRDFPYGNVEEQVCNAGDIGSNDTEPVGSHPQCVGGYEGIFDLVGNVAEWEDTCSPTLATELEDPCLTRGDDFDTIGSASCMESFGVERLKPEAYIGFRCCSLLR